MIRLLWGQEAHLWASVRAEYARMEAERNAMAEMVGLLRTRVSELQKELATAQSRFDYAINALLRSENKPEIPLVSPTPESLDTMFDEDEEVVEALRDQLKKDPESAWRESVWPKS